MCLDCGRANYEIHCKENLELVISVTGVYK